MPLSKEELIRYNRQIILPGFGKEGQQKLKNAKILVIGAGGLGVPNLLYLTAAGVGTVGIVDFDRISLTNLQRQVLYQSHETGQSKAAAATQKLKLLNPETEVKVFETRITSENAFRLMEGFDLIIDGSDNLPTRYLVNDACVLLDKPLVYGAIFQYEGQVSVFNAPGKEGTRGPNYRDLFPVPPPPDMVPDCSEGGVFGALAGIVGSIQANEALKLITGLGTTLSGKLLLLDSLDFTTRYLNLRSNPSNPLTGSAPSLTRLIDYEAFCKGHAHDEEKFDSMTVTELDRQLREYPSTVILDVREPYEYEVSNLGGLNIPLHTLEQNLAEIPSGRPLVVHCRSGTRSRQAVRILHKNGFRQAKDLEGGLLAWQQHIDPALIVY